MNSVRGRRRSLAFSNRDTSQPYVLAAAVSIGALIVSALVNQSRARKAERDNPPIGNFVAIDGVRLHYIERGSGEPLVLLHGNGSMIQDFESSGLVDAAAPNFRVIVFDRPGFGHSDRPRNVVWTPDAQAELIKRALEELGVTNAISGSLVGSVCRSCDGAQISDVCSRADLGVGLLLPDLAH